MIFFWSNQNYHWLSNFEKVEITLDGKVWPSVEHYYQAQKSNDPLMQEEFRNYKSAAKTKRKSKKLILRPDWDLIKISVMEKALIEKYKQEPFRSKLIETFPSPIVEDSPLDKFWGSGKLSSLGDGQNMMGQLLEKIRADLVKNSQK